MSEEVSASTRRLIAGLRAGDLPYETGFLVGLDRPALLAPDPGSLLAAQRPEDVLVTGHRWRVVTDSLWHDLLALGRERPEQQVYVVTVAAIETWLDDPAGFAELDRDGWRGNQGTVYVLPVPD